MRVESFLDVLSTYPKEYLVVFVSSEESTSDFLKGGYTSPKNAQICGREAKKLNLDGVLGGGIEKIREELKRCFADENIKMVIVDEIARKVFTNANDNIHFQWLVNILCQTASYELKQITDEDQLNTAIYSMFGVFRQHMAEYHSSCSIL